QRLRKFILDVFLKRSLKRPRSIAAVGTGLFYQPLPRLVRNRQRQPASRQYLVKSRNLHLDDRLKVRVRQLVKDDHLIQTVDKFRSEGALHLCHHAALDHLARSVSARLESHVPALLNEPGAEVRGHYKDRVLAVDRGALSV